MGYPTAEAEEELMASQKALAHPVTTLSPVSDPATLRSLQDLVLSVEVGADVMDYILSLVAETRGDPRLVLGASPRASMALYKGSQALALLKGREEASARDVRDLAPEVLLKRIAVKPEYQLKGVTEEAVIEDILSRMPLPERAGV